MTMFNRRSLMLCSVLVAAASLSACASSNMSGYSKAPMAQVAVVQNPDFNNGIIPGDAYEKIQVYSASCQYQIGKQTSGPVTAAASGAVEYGVAGAGTGPAAKLAFTGVGMGPYAIYGAGAYVLPGAVNGLTTGSYSRASGIGNCTKDFFGDIKGDHDNWKGTHIEVVFAGKGGPPPALQAAPPLPRNDQAARPSH